MTILDSILLSIYVLAQLLTVMRKSFWKSSWHTSSTGFAWKGPAKCCTHSGTSWALKLLISLSLFLRPLLMVSRRKPGGVEVEL